MTRVFESLQRFVILIGLIATAAWAQADTTLTPDRTRQIISLPTVQGDAVRLDDLAGAAVLLAFIRTQTDPTAQIADPSRAQLVQLKSLARQYGSEELQVLLVAADTPKKAALKSFVDDQGLQQIPLLLDEEGEATRTFNVTHLPTTLLLGTEGRVSARWEGVTGPAELAFAVQRALGLSP